MLVTPRLSEGIYFLEATISNKYESQESVMENTLDDDGQKSYSEMDGKTDDDNGEKNDENKVKKLEHK